MIRMSDYKQIMEVEQQEANQLLQQGKWKLAKIVDRMDKITYVLGLIGE